MGTFIGTAQGLVVDPPLTTTTETIPRIGLEGGFFTNPMTTAGDMIDAGTGGTPERLPIGSNGQVLTVSAGAPAWEAAPGFANPMTAAGDLIDGGTGGTPQRLAIGSNGQVLTVSGGAPAWEAAAGFTNPMTTAGDLIDAGTGGTPQRLAIGSNGQVLTVSAGAPAWETPTAGGFTQIAQHTLASAAPSVTFSGIPNTFTSLKLVINARSTDAATQDNMIIQFNADTTAADYIFQVLFPNGAGTPGGGQGTNGVIAAIAAASALASVFSGVEIIIPGYAGTTWLKTALSQAGALAGASFAAASGFLLYAGVTWNNTAAISSITLALATGPDFAAGSQFTLYGLA